MIAWRKRAFVSSYFHGFDSILTSGVIVIKEPTHTEASTKCQALCQALHVHYLI